MSNVRILEAVLVGLFLCGGCTPGEVRDEELDEIDQAINLPAAEDNPMVVSTSPLYLKDANTWATYTTWMNAVGSQVPLSTLVSTSLNRTGVYLSSSTGPLAPAGAYKYGMKWAAGDQSVDYWIPQGMTMGTVGSTSVSLVAWRYVKNSSGGSDANPPSGQGYTSKGVRVAIVNTQQVINGSGGAYRLVLLVEPTASGNFKPIENHAGGLAWYGDYLYEADTYGGIRVFNLNNIRSVSTSSTCNTKIGSYSGLQCAFGYAYVLPQVSYYQASDVNGSLGNPWPRKFSFLGKDVTQTTPVVLSGEYCNTTDATCRGDSSGVNGELYRWPVNASTNKLVVNASNIVTPQRVYVTNKRNNQGVAPISDTSTMDDYYLAGTRYEGILVYARTGSDPGVNWCDNDGNWGKWTQNIHASAGTSGNIWVNSEGNLPDIDPRNGGRSLYAVDDDFMAP
jgi:hypothetical protein